MKRLVALGAAAIMVLAMAAPAAAGNEEKVWQCHATASETNPWILVHVAADTGHGKGGPAVHQNVDAVVDGDLVDLLGLKAGPLGADFAFICEPGGPQ